MKPAELALARPCIRITIKDNTMGNLTTTGSGEGDEFTSVGFYRHRQKPARLLQPMQNFPLRELTSITVKPTLTPILSEGIFHEVVPQFPLRNSYYSGGSRILKGGRRIHGTEVQVQVQLLDTWLLLTCSHSFPPFYLMAGDLQ